MDFHLDFSPPASAHKLSHDKPILLIGSCFTENIGQKFDKAGFKTYKNPSGILFNPISVCETLLDALDPSKKYTEDLFFYNDAFHSWKHHSLFSSASQQLLNNKIETSRNKTHLFLQNAHTIIITLGSAWVYELSPKAKGYTSGKVAANNHKAPADWFSKRLLKPEEIFNMFQHLINRLDAFIPGIHIIFTVSPVRHTREGLIDNNRSKASLIQAVHDIVIANRHTSYFPAYELVIDDLRDYRFYAEDMVHPNYAATNYVWEKIINVYFSDDTKLLAERFLELQTAYAHIPFNEDSQAHRKFMENYKQKAISLKEQYSFLDLEKLIDYFSK